LVFATITCADNRVNRVSRDWCRRVDIDTCPRTERRLQTAEFSNSRELPINSPA
jgi:hypothetical protein